MSCSFPLIPGTEDSLSATTGSITSGYSTDREFRETRIMHKFRTPWNIHPRGIFTNHSHSDEGFKSLCSKFVRFWEFQINILEQKLIDSSCWAGHVQRSLVAVRKFCSLSCFQNFLTKATHCRNACSTFVWSNFGSLLELLYLSLDPAQSWASTQDLF